MFREIWFSIKDFEWYENISLIKDGLMYKMLSFLSLISLVCSVFRNEERVVFIAIIVFFPLSCCLAFFLIFNQSSCFFKNFFCLRDFSAVIDMVVLHFWISINQVVFLWKTFLLKRFFSRNWYGCLAFLNFNQSSYFLWKLFFLRDFSAVIDMVVLHFWISINQVAFFENFSS